MAFRFQKRIKILPGVGINLSKSGISTSIGPQGAKVTIGHGKMRQTVGIPGTGLSYSTVKSNKPAQGQETPGSGGMGFWKLLAWGMAALFAFLLIKGALG